MATKALSKAASIERYEKQGAFKVLTRVIDFALAANALAAQNDIAEAIDVRANTRVLAVRWEVLTVEGAARNFGVGDGVNDVGYIASADSNALGEGSTLVAGYVNTSDAGAAQDPVVLNPAFSAGKYYAAADTIDIKALSAGGLVGAKIKVSAEVVEYDL